MAIIKYIGITPNLNFDQAKTPHCLIGIPLGLPPERISAKHLNIAEVQSVAINEGTFSFVNTSPFTNPAK